MQLCSLVVHCTSSLAVMASGMQQALHFSMPALLRLVVHAWRYARQAKASFRCSLYYDAELGRAEWCSPVRTACMAAGVCC